jgi:nitronate monooxygenase
MRHHTDAPSAFPEIHNATRPLRAAAARAGDAHTINLWAGTGHRHARTGSTAGIVDWLLSELPS